MDTWKLVIVYIIWHGLRKNWCLPKQPIILNYKNDTNIELIFGEKNENPTFVNI